MHLLFFTPQARRTALHIAAARGRGEVVRVLVEVRFGLPLFGALLALLSRFLTFNSLSRGELSTAQTSTCTRKSATLRSI